MGTGILRVTPEILAQVAVMLPSSYRIVGSRDGDPYVALALASDLIDGDDRELTATCIHQENTFTVRIDQVS